MLHSILIFACLFTGIFAQFARADESYFGYIYTTDLLPQGKWEYEQLNTFRTGKARGSYSALDFRNEFEYGVTNNFSASF